MLEILEFQHPGRDPGLKLSHGTSLKFADVRTHLRKVSKNTISVYFLNPSKLLEGASTCMVSRAMDW